MTPGLLALIAASLAFLGFGSMAYELAVYWRERRISAICGGISFAALIVMWLVATGRIFA